MRRNSGINILYCINIFIVFLMLFESRLQLPNWLQPIGRLHPLILHFPIVLLLLALGIDFFSYSSKNKSQPVYQSITSNLLLGGTLAAGLTAIMGIFLSKEGGYDSSILMWHKWSGIIIVFITSFIYWARAYSWYKVMVARITILITTVCIFTAGHYGATLTHGENFVLAPLTTDKPTNIAFTDAEVYEHLIQPVFKSKCQSCHNTEKDKGELKLLDSVSIIKGGKSGVLFVAGNPEISLLLKRIHLGEENKKHMPPVGKPQLNESEKQLLYWWIRNGAPFNKKLAELPVNDSLRIVAANFINANESKEETYSFSAADAKLIQSLNNKNRTVYSLSKESPALGVNMFNSSVYSARIIEELKPVKEQIITLEANRLPVKDEDLKLIGAFNNLRKLSLNFTDITAKGLRELVNLKELASLSLSGTKLNYKELQTLMPSFGNLKKVFVWDAGLDTNEIKLLRKKYSAIEWNAGFVDDGAHPLQLNKVILQNTTQVFSELINVKLRHAIKGVEIRYTIDGSKPDSISSRVFNGNVELKNNTILKTKAYKQGWIKSETTEFSFFKNRVKPDSVVLSTALYEKFPGMGKETFFDGQLGGLSPFGDKWAGISGKPMNIVMLFNRPIFIESVSIQILIDSVYAAFPPNMVEIWGGFSEKELHLLSRARPITPGKNVKNSIERIDYNFSKQQVNYLKLVVKPPNWPAWHSNKGKSALLMIDEIFLN